MKRTLILLLIIIICAGVVSAQDRVSPNRPNSSLFSGSGYVTINELTAGLGLAHNIVPYSKSFFGFTRIHGYQIDQNFFPGAGTGASFYNGGAMIPLFLDIRCSFRINPITPYFSGMEDSCSAFPISIIIQKSLSIPESELNTP